MGEAGIDPRGKGDTHDFGREAEREDELLTPPGDRDDDDIGWFADGHVGNDGDFHGGAHRSCSLLALASSKCSPSCQRAMVHTRSESRLRYGITKESTRPAATASRSARRTVVRATSSDAATRFWPGTTNSVGMAKVSVNRSISASRAETIWAVTRVTPAASLVRFSGRVATSAINT